MKYFTKDALRRIALALNLGFVWADRRITYQQAEALFAELRPRAIDRMIRCGGNGDGGYLLPDCLNGISLCVSPGVSDEVGFDLSMADRGMTVLMADASVEGPPFAHPKFRFVKKFLGLVTDEIYIRMKDLLYKEKWDGKEEYILQMDIEGSEIPVLLDMEREVINKARIIVVEFHNLHRAFMRRDYLIYYELFRKMNKEHQLIHVHANNYCGQIRHGKYTMPRALEFTYIRKDWFEKFSEVPFNSPHPLDRINVQGFPDLRLGECWWSKNRKSR